MATRPLSFSHFRDLMDEGRIDEDDHHCRMPYEFRA